MPSPNDSGWSMRSSEVGDSTPVLLAKPIDRTSTVVGSLSSVGVELSEDTETRLGSLLMVLTSSFLVCLRVGIW